LKLVFCRSDFSPSTTQQAITMMAKTQKKKHYGKEP
jgi:hypothetical protein